MPFPGRRVGPAHAGAVRLEPALPRPKSSDSQAVNIPHLDKIEDAGELERELLRIQDFYDTVRLRQSLGYVTPEEEHHGLGPVIRKARRVGLGQARAARVATRRKLRQDPM
ncbi:MAG: hypothetical protein HKP61_01085 [Dactylosporangium sp.]|nr:hypothetical protein [Dactylosporangium sp.]NNJ59564.1 hypothetical protein [Dactylosporangium sp.]